MMLVKQKPELWPPDSKDIEKQKAERAALLKELSRLGVPDLVKPKVTW
jgi:hypothetical protein